MTRELLKEARDDLVWIAGAYSDDKPMAYNASAAYEMSCTAKIRIERIDAALAAPEPTAMELVDQLSAIINSPFDTVENRKAKAASLIADYGRRVPSALFDEIIQIQPLSYAKLGRAFAKYGVEVEG